MIYTLGCSFTKWFWPTWADYLQEYKGPVTNLAWPGLSNEVMYWELLNRADAITSDDEVYIMLSGNNRVSQWYDKEWIDTKDVQGFFPRQDGKLELSDQPWRGMYRLHPDFDVSLTHMIVDNFNIIFNIQQLLNSIGCKYKMVFWQNPWYDVRPNTKGTWSLSWPTKSLLTKQEIKTATEILQIKAVRNLVSRIDWAKFGSAPTDKFNPETYSGFWEYKLEKQKQAEYMQYAHCSDPHPDPVLQHDFLVQVIYPTQVNHDIREMAQINAIAAASVNTELGRAKLIPDTFEKQIRKQNV
jgi:hypothetical protein